MRTKMNERRCPSRAAEQPFVRTRRDSRLIGICRFALFVEVFAGRREEYVAFIGLQLDYGVIVDLVSNNRRRPAKPAQIIGSTFR